MTMLERPCQGHPDGAINYPVCHRRIREMQFQEFTQNFGAEMLNGRRISALRSSTSGHGSFRTRLLQRSSIVPPEAHYKAHGPRVSHTGSLFFNKICRPPVRLGRNHVERRTRKTAVCGQRTETPPKKWVNSCGFLA